MAVSAVPGTQSAGAISLGVDGGAFTVNGQAKFLVFISYFDGLDVSDANLAADFAWLKSKKVDGVRVFPNWWNKTGGVTSYSPNPLITEDGTLDAARLAKLGRLLTTAKRHGLVVDISISGENVKKCVGPACAASEPFVASGTLTKDELRSALVALAADLRRNGVRHALIDIQNEADHNTLVVPSSGRAPLAAADIKDIVAAIKAVNPDQLLTASISGGTSAAEAGVFSTLAGLEVVAWHEARENSWWTRTGANVAAIRKSTAAPVYLQEPQPSDEAGWTVEGAIAGLRAAMSAGAAAWTFHSRSSFLMNGRSLKAVVAADKSPNDRKFLGQLSAISRK